ncbi:MAG: T9SS type A sorting domain-containing protein [Bacteroidia bacterium]
MKKSVFILFGLFAVFTAQAQWQKVTPPATAQQVLTEGNTIYLGGYGSISKSTDNGVTWTKIDSGIVSKQSNCTGIIKVGNRLVASYGGNGNHYVYYSDNSGETWNLDTANWAPPIIGSVRPFSRITLNYKNTHTICVLESNYILFKSNTDNQWNSLNPPASHRTPNAIHISGDTIFLFQLRSIDYTCDVIYTVNLGNNWETLTQRSNINVRGVPHKNKQNNTIYVGLVTRAGEFDEAIWTSSNNGLQWDTLANRNFGTLDFLTGLWADGNLLIATFNATNRDTLNKVMMSEDGGITWLNITENLMGSIQFKFQPIQNPTVVGNKLWITQGGNLYWRNINSSTGMYDADLNNHFEVYPNPTLNYIKVSGTFKSISMYNALGKLIIPHQNNTELNLSNLPTGVYYLQITDANQTVVTKKVVKQ